MIFYKDQTNISFTNKAYSKRLIAGAFAVCCLSTSASAMLSPLRSQYSACQLLRLAIQVDAPLFRSFSVLSPSNANNRGKDIASDSSKRPYHVPIIIQYGPTELILIETLRGKSYTEVMDILERSAAAGVNQEALDLAHSLYAESKTPTCLGSMTMVSNKLGQAKTSPQHHITDYSGC